VGSETGARFVARELVSAGFEVELDRRRVLLSMPRRIHVSLSIDGQPRFTRTGVFDPRAIPPGDVPIYSAWSASGEVTAEVVDLGEGLRADYEAARERGVVVKGRIVLARYGGAYRGVKAELAQAHGARAILLYNDPAVDGTGKGRPYPFGPWKPGWAARRGSISSLTVAPGDMSTPGWPSPPPGVSARRLTEKEWNARLPHILCTPITGAEYTAIRDAGSRGRVTLELDLGRELFDIVNVIATLRGESEDFVLVGNHRDAWVRGAHDAGSGTVALVRAAQLLRERVEDGWKPECTLVLAFWDAEEFGLIGSTEWGEAHAERLREHGRLYVNADSTVSGLRFGVNGSPGWSSVLAATLARIPDARHDESAPARSLLDTWDARGEPAQLGLPGSGSDFTVFVHHLGVPALNFSFRGNRGGQYHTRFDDFDHMDRFLDPTWRGHETAARFVCELVSEVSARGRSALDGAEAATSLALRVREAGTEVVDGSRWLGSVQAERLASVLETIAAQFHEGREDPRFYQGLLQEGGLEGRPWYRNPLWAPGMETGYAAETLPDLRLAAGRGPAELDRAVEALESALEAYRDAWRPDPGRSLPREEGAPADL